MSGFFALLHLLLCRTESLFFKRHKTSQPGPLTGLPDPHGSKLRYQGVSHVLEPVLSWFLENQKLHTIANIQVLVTGRQISWPPRFDERAGQSNIFLQRYLVLDYTRCGFFFVIAFP